jgi:SCP-2 sterol transfer family
VDRGSTATAEFFDQLGRRGHEPGLEEMDGTIRFDLRHEHGIDHWLVVVRNGDVRVTRDAGAADCVLHSDRSTFDQIVTGKLAPLPAWFRHLYWIDGNAALVRAFNYIYPGPANARHPRDLVRERGQG